MLIFILDKINQFLCSHDKRWETSQEIERVKAIQGSNFTHTFDWVITTEYHCNKCGKKRFETTLK